VILTSAGTGKQKKVTQDFVVVELDHLTNSGEVGEDATSNTYKDGKSVSAKPLRREYAAHSRAVFGSRKGQQCTLLIDIVDVDFPLCCPEQKHGVVTFVPTERHDFTRALHRAQTAVNYDFVCGGRKKRTGGSLGGYLSPFRSQRCILSCFLSAPLGQLHFVLILLLVKRKRLK